MPICRRLIQYQWYAMIPFQVDIELKSQTNLVFQLKQIDNTIIRLRDTDDKD